MALPVLNKSVYTVKLKSTQETVEYTPYNVAQEKNLLLAKESGDIKRITEQTMRLIHECIITPNVDVAKLTTFDIELLFLSLRCKSVGEGVKIYTECKNLECDYHGELPINLSNLHLTEKIKSKEEMDIVVSEDQGIGIRLRYPTSKDISLKGDNDFEKTFNLIASCITHIYTKEEIFDCKAEGIDSVLEFIGNLYEDQFKVLTDWFDTIPAVELRDKYNCPKCDYVNDIKVSGLSNFFT